MEKLKDNIARCLSIAFAFMFGTATIVSAVAGIMINPWCLVASVLCGAVSAVSIGIVCFLDTNSLSDLKGRRD